MKHALGAMVPFKELIAILGGWTVITIGVIAAATKLVNERIFFKWRREEQFTLEGLKHSFSNERLLLEATIRGSQQGRDASHEKRLVAVERLWQAVLQLREASDGIRLFYGVLAPEEYDPVYRKGGSFAASISNVNDDYITGFMKKVDDVELQRPYLGEVLWLRFFIYRAFVGRLVFIITKGKEKGHIEDWRKDNGVRQILAGILPSGTFDSLTKNFGSIYPLFGQLESIILEEISLIVSGRRSASESFDSAKELHEAVLKFSREQRTNA
jgi:hypothetical protein